VSLLQLGAGYGARSRKSEEKEEGWWCAVKFFGDDLLWWHYFFLGLLLLVLVSLMVVEPVRGLTIPAGDCVNVTVDNVSEEYCAGFPDVVSINMSLDPGGSDYADLEFCEFHASCSPCEQEGTVCKKTRSLEPGEDYELVDGACDLEFTCEESEEVEQDEDDFFDYYAPVTVKKVGEEVSVELDGERVAWTLYDQDVNIDYELLVSCPLEVEDDNIERFSDESLVKYATLLDFYPQLTQQVLRVSEVCDNKTAAKDKVIRDKEVEVKSARSEVDVLNTRLGQCLTEKDTEVAKFQLMKNETVDLKLDNRRKGDATAMMAFFLFVSLFINALLTWAYLKNRGGDAS
jgi:hypothetical protein